MAKRQPKPVIQECHVHDGACGIRTAEGERACLPHDNCVTITTYESGRVTSCSHVSADAHVECRLDHEQAPSAVDKRKGASAGGRIDAREGTCDDCKSILEPKDPHTARIERMVRDMLAKERGR